MCLDTITQLVNIPGFRVTAITKMTEKEIHIRVEESSRTNMGTYHSSQIVVAEGISLGQRRLYLHILKRKYKNSETNIIETQKISWIEKRSRVTKALAEQVYRLTAITTNTEAGWFLEMDDQKVYRIDKAKLNKLSDEKLKPTPFSENISVDEVAWKKHHRYLTNVVDVDKKVITWNAKGRKVEVLDMYYEDLGRKNCEKIQTVSLDGARTYISSTNKYAVNALIVLDRFHVVQKINKAVEAVRRIELNKARKNKNEELIELTNCKQRFMLIKNKSKRTSRQVKNLERLCAINKPIYKGLLLKESFLGVYDLKSEDEAIDYLYNWIDDALNSKLEPFKEIAWSLIDKKIEYILNWFISKRSSAISEGFNNKIKRLKRMAYGFKDIEYFKLKIHQHCGYLNPRRFLLN